MTTDLIDPDTESLAREIARATAKPVQTIVREAIAAKAEAAGIVRKRRKFTPEELVARMTALSDHCASLPVLDPRTPDEIIGYDEFGVPR